MGNTVSPFFSDEDLCTQLMLQFDDDVRYTMNYKTVFNQICDEGDCFSLRLRGRRFLIDKVTGIVREEKIV